jgi:hypothetical protein
MISIKYEEFQSPLDISLDINKLLIQDIGYKESKNYEYTERTTNYIIKKEENIFNKIINDCNDTKILDMLMSNSKFVMAAPRFIGTPAFFINGVQFTKPFSFDLLSEAIDDAIKDTKVNLIPKE